MHADEISRAIQVLRQAKIDGRNGLPENLFLMISGLVPLPNVDLLITNKENQLLLSRRNDTFFQPSWHIPGGCMRYGESFERRIQQTALRELGTEIEFDPEPVTVRNVLRGENLALEHPNERGHNVAILFRGRLPYGFEIDNGNKSEQDDGYLKWFDHLPRDFMKIQNVYSDILQPWKTKEEIV